KPNHPLLCLAESPYSPATPRGGGIAVTRVFSQVRCTLSRFDDLRAVTFVDSFGASDRTFIKAREGSALQPLTLGTGSAWTGTTITEIALFAWWCSAAAL